MATATPPTLSQDNPIRIFFSKGNAEKLYGYIKTGLRERYKVEIDNRYMEQMIDIMKMVIEPLPKKIPVDVDKKWFLKTLNEQAIREALPIFAEIATKKRALPHPDVPARAAEAGAGGPISFMKRPQSTPLTFDSQTPSQEPRHQPRRRERESHDDLAPPPPPPHPQQSEAAYQNLLETRQENNQQEAPIFEDPPVEYSDDVNDLYEFAEQQRYSRGEQHPPQHLQHPQHPQSPPPQPRSESYRNSAPPAPRQQPHIPPPSPQLEETTTTTLLREHIYVVNSNDRETKLFPSPSQFRLELHKPFVDVHSVELVQTNFPLSAVYNVNANNNVIHFGEGDDVELPPQSAIIPIGNYPDARTLALSVAASMTAASSCGIKYFASVKALTGQIVLSSCADDEANKPPPTFNLYFDDEKSVGGVLGFASEKYTDKHSYEAPYVPNLRGLDAVYLHIAGVELLESNNTEVSGAFARIVKGKPMRAVKHYSPPLGKITNLIVCVRDAHGNLVDFNGQNYSFVLKISVSVTKK